LNRRIVTSLSLVVVLPIAVAISYFTFAEVASLLPGSGVGNSVPLSESILFLILIQGGLYSAMILGILGSLKSSRALMITAAVIFLLESIPFVFDGLFILTLPPGFFLWNARNPEYLLGNASYP
jgi:hypothetical protein